MSWEDDILFAGVDDDAIRREKSRARELRKSRWWQNRISAGKCEYCGKGVHPKELTMDHVIPLARGGRSEKNNLVPCCKECNSKKKSALPQEWDEYVQGFGDR
ncbi:MAG: HNH endonuclease [Proteobacteria bacterium]|nr:HNH endonuclease [Pseudomonadota bacterium]MBU1736725.1 HNH endonuclease [Pseudomonadota bacterium]